MYPLILQNIAARHPWLSGHVNPGRSLDDVAYRASFVFPIKQSWPSDGMRGTAHMVRAVRFVRWLRGGSACPRGAKSSFHVPFPPPPLWRGRGRRCVATAASPPGTRLSLLRWSWRGASLPWGQGHPLPRPLFSLSPTPLETLAAAMALHIGVTATARAAGEMGAEASDRRASPLQRPKESC
jgi:hypothetical protein